jgi:hypothetical protein
LGAAVDECAEGEDDVASGDEIDDVGPEVGEGVCGDDVVRRGIAPDVLDDVVAVALDDEFCGRLVSIVRRA